MLNKLLLRIYKLNFDSRDCHKGLTFLRNKPKTLLVMTIHPSNQSLTKL